MPEEEVIEADFAEVGKVVEADDSRPFERLDLEDVMSVRLRLTAELGQARIRVREVLALKVGSIVTLDRMAGELTDIFVNGLPLARGEVVVISDVLHVRMSEILTNAESLERERG
ncbi:MAG: FliM/FliN family flagellar motor switch protein [Candidatus Hydrogenedentes bacterium]|nr:FliM/FliN family flagellar motor switch protein [Candidatus Hydrogenedentota bacterium]